MEVKVKFFIPFILSIAVLAGIERFINGSNEWEHLLGWTFVALAFAALVAILGKKETTGH